MNRERRHTHTRRPYRLRVPAGLTPRCAVESEMDPAELAPWVIPAVRAWPRSVEDRVVAARMGVGLRTVQLARRGGRPVP